MKTIVDKHPSWGRTDVFEIVEEWPEGYQLWNIGRSNFRHEGYLPLCIEGEKRYYVNLNKLKALYLGDEDLCLYIMKKGGLKTVEKEDYLKLRKEYESRRILREAR